MAGEQRSGKARLVGINHVALEVGDIDEALAFWGRLFEVTLRGRSETMAFIDLGDQFIALSTGRTQAKDEDRHFGLVVDDRAPLRLALAEMGVKILPGRGLDFLDPWGNRIQMCPLNSKVTLDYPSGNSGFGGHSGTSQLASGSRGAGLGALSGSCTSKLPPTKRQNPCRMPQGKNGAELPGPQSQTLFFATAGTTA